MPDPAPIPPAPIPPPTVAMRDPATGRVYDVPRDQVATYAAQQFVAEAPAERDVRLADDARTQAYSGAANTATAALAGIGRGASLGLTDVAARALGGDQAALDLSGLRDAHPGVSYGAELAGAVAPGLITGGAALPAGLASRAGAAVARVGAEAGIAGRIGGAALGGAAEGALYGLGGGASELALSTDPLTVERAASTLSSSALFGAVTGGAAGAAFKGAELGLGAAKKALDGALTKRAEARALEERAATTPTEITAETDLATLDKDGLKRAHQQEIEAIDTARDPARKEFADQLSVFGGEMRDLQLSSATSGLAEREVRESGAALARADMDIRRLTDNPVGLAERPQRALGALQTQEHALEGLIDASKSARREFQDRVSTTAEEYRAKLIANAAKARAAEAKALDAAEMKAAKVHTTKAAEAAEAAEALQLARAKAGESKAADLRITRAAKAAEAAEAKAAEAKAGLDAAKSKAAESRAGKITAARAGDELSLPAIDRAVEQHVARRFGGAARTPDGEWIYPKRVQALERVPEILQRNRELQQQLRAVTAAPMSERLTAIEGAQDAHAARMGAPAAKEETSPVAAALQAAAPFAGPLGAVASVGVSALGRLRKVASAAGERAGKAASRFLDVAGKTAGKAAPRAPAVASKVLASISYAPKGAGAPPREHAPTKDPLARDYLARANEIQSQIEIVPSGAYQMRQEARLRMASKLDGFRALDPIGADQIETIMARRLEYLASVIPKRPDFGTMPIGPDRHVPSDLEIRGFARIAAALEDPHAVFERAADGRVTPEEAAAIRAVYPELLKHFTDEIVSKLPTLQRTLPYKRRLSLSILTGVPVDPAMTPAILRVLQGMYASEPGTAGGTQAPRAQAQFGSVKRSEPGTASQRREGLK